MPSYKSIYTAVYISIIVLSTRHIRHYDALYMHEVCNRDSNLQYQEAVVVVVQHFYYSHNLITRGLVQ
jgi:hypothetical protein